RYPLPIPAGSIPETGLAQTMLREVGNFADRQGRRTSRYGSGGCRPAIKLSSDMLRDHFGRRYVIEISKRPYKRTDMTPGGRHEEL
ncbi:MAG: hypothetical protein WCA23_07280, partial [Stellaceae bacterium]